MIALLLHVIGLVCLMSAGHIEYKAKRYQAVTPNTQAGNLRAISNLAILAWIGFGFGAAYWQAWYWALGILLLSVMVPGLYARRVIQLGLTRSITKFGLLTGLILCGTAIVIG